MERVNIAEEPGCGSQHNTGRGTEITDDFAADVRRTHLERAGPANLLTLRDHQPVGPELTLDASRGIESEGALDLELADEPTLENRVADESIRVMDGSALGHREAARGAEAFVNRRVDVVIAQVDIRAAL